MSLRESGHTVTGFFFKKINADCFSSRPCLCHCSAAFTQGMILDAEASATAQWACEIILDLIRVHRVSLLNWNKVLWQDSFYFYPCVKNLICSINLRTVGGRVGGIFILMLIPQASSFDTFICDIPAEPALRMKLQTVCSNWCFLHTSINLEINSALFTPTHIGLVITHNIICLACNCNRHTGLHVMMLETTALAYSALMYCITNIIKHRIWGQSAYGRQSWWHTNSIHRSF